MTSRNLKIALAVSVALNLFAIAAGISAYVNHTAAQARIEQARPERERVSFMEEVDALDPAARQRVKDALRAAAMSARPDFRDARDARREAIALTESDAFDAREVAALLERSRASENRGRTILETEAVRILSELAPEQRGRLSGVLRRHGPRHRGDDRRRDEQPPPPPGPGAPDA